MDHPVVRTTSGAVRGRSTGDVDVFRGIPYAAPLDGPRRFRAPAPPEPWDGVREASSFSASVPQPEPLPGMPRLWKPGDDTDCLTVNVWTPDRGARLPVMVWLYGGALISGGSAMRDYDGAVLARSGVVVVTLNYRVGYEGFGWVDDAPANRGTLDQIAALRWVRDNIAAFGGDPDAVTVFGESAGAVSTAALVASPAARGLLHRAIAQSVAGMYLPEDEARKSSGLVTGRLDVPATAEALAGIPPERFHLAQQEATAEMSANRESWTQTMPYGVVLDGELLDAPPWRAMRDGAGRDIDLICGFTTDEAKLFTVDLPGVKDLGALARGLRLPESALDDYRTGHPGITDAELYDVVFGDQLLRMPSLWCAEGHADGGGATYLYEFAWPAPGRGGAYGACHALDVPFTFGVRGTELAGLLFDGTVPEDFDVLSGELRHAWTTFAATGDPGWPRYSTSARPTKIWHVPSRVEQDPLAVSRRIWQRRFWT